MIVKNEEKTLEKCLESISWFVDEIIIVDTGSIDKTVEIAKKYTNKVEYFEWVNDFSKARNYAQQFASHEFVLRWDADEILRDGKENLRKLKENELSNLDLAYFTWNVDFGIDRFPIRQIQNLYIYRKDLFHWESPIHNKLVLNNKGDVVRQKFIQEIEVDHLKDPIEKQTRYKQTDTLLDTVLERQPDLRGMDLKLQSLIFQGEFKDASVILDKMGVFSKDSEVYKVSDSYTASIFELATRVYIELKDHDSLDRICKLHKDLIKKDAVALLAYADAISPTNPKEAISLYEKYLDNPVKKELDVRPYNYERYVVHPLEMLGILHAFLKNTELAKVYWSDASKKTKKGNTKEVLNKYIKALLTQS